MFNDLADEELTPKAACENPLLQVFANKRQGCLPMAISYRAERCIFDIHKSDIF